MSELYHSHRNRVRRRKARPWTGDQYVETLENRKLMSVTLDLRLPGGGKSATVTGTGQQIGLEVWATVKGANSSASDDGFQTAHGSLLSTNVNGGAANGTLSVTIAAPFNGTGSQGGTQKDLDGDGDLDVGSNDNTTPTGFFVTRADSMRYGTSFKIGTAVFTVTSLKSTTGSTNLVYRVRKAGLNPLWVEDNMPRNPQSGGIATNGSAVVLKRSGGGTSPPPPPPPPPTSGASVSGIVFSDTDKDGVVDSGEPRLSGKKIYIDANKNAKLDSGEKYTTSNSSGVYVLSGLAAGTYQVRRADLPVGYKYSTPSIGYHSVTLTSGQQVTNRNFGAIPATTTTPPPTGSASVSGIVFSDTDKDGIVDSGEPRLSGKKIYIDANKNGKLDSGEKYTTSNSSGVYVLSGLAAGSYQVRRADLPTGYKYSTPSIGYHSVTLTSGQQVTNRNFGAILATTTTTTTGGKITGTVFSDADRDGILDSTDTRLANKRIYIDSNLNGRYDSGEKYSISNSSGVYTLSGLSAGTYRVRRADLPTGYKYSTPSIGYHTVILGTNQTISGRNFGAVLI